MSVASERGSSKGAATRGRSSGSAGSRSSGSAGSRSQGASRRASSRTTSRKSSQNGRSGRSTASSRSSSARSNAEDGNGASTSGAQSSGNRSQSSGNRSQASGKRSQTSGNRASQRSQGSENGTRETVTNVAVPILTATLGVAGGVLLGRAKLQRSRKVLGIPVPNTKIDLSGLTQQIGEAGRQFGKLAGEVRSVREKAEQIGRAVS